MNRQQQLLLSLVDEVRWTSLLRASIPTIRFLNDNVWVGAPDERNGIESCSSGLVYLFDGDIGSLPTRPRKTGELEGPISGCVVQVIRPSVLNGLYLSGRVAAGCEHGDSKMKLMVSRIWTTLKGLGSIGVLRPDGEIDKNYVVGMDLAAKVKSGEAKIADRATKMIYQLPE